LRAEPTAVRQFAVVILIIMTITIKKSEAILATDRGGQQGCEMSRLSHFLENWRTDGDKVVSLTRRQRFTPPVSIMVLISVRG
jgi:hypothetical protein